jgi:hypothetical protein
MLVSSVLAPKIELVMVMPSSCSSPPRCGHRNKGEESWTVIYLSTAGFEDATDTTGRISSTALSKVRADGKILGGPNLVENVSERNGGLRKCGQQRGDILRFSAHGAIHGELGSLPAHKKALNQKQSPAGELVPSYGWARDEKVIGKTLPSTLDQFCNAVSQNAQEILG